MRKISWKMAVVFALLLGVGASGLFAQTARGSIDVRTPIAGVRVWVDDELKGETTKRFGMNILSIPNVSVGRHTVRCEATGYEPYQRDIVVKVDTTTPLQVEFRRPNTRAIGEEQSKGEQRALTGSIRVRTTPSGASVMLDGRYQSAKTDLTLTPVPVGKHRIRVQLADVRLETDVTVENGTEAEILADFYKETIDTIAKYTLNINSTPAGVLYVDGRKIGQTPQSVTVKNGHHTVTIRAPGYQEFTKRYDIQETVLEKVTLAPRRYTLAMTGTPVGAAAFLLDGSSQPSRIGTIPFSVQMRPGSYRIRIDDNGYEATTRSITVLGSQDRTTVTVRLRALHARLSASVVDVSDRLPVAFYVNDRLVGRAPFRNQEIPAEEVKLSVRVSGRSSVLFRSYSIKPDHHYVLSYTPRLPLLERDVDVTKLSGYQYPPPEPSYLPTTKWQKVTVPWAPSYAVYGLGGMGAGVMTGLVIWGLSDNTTSSNLTRNALIGGALGAAVGLLGKIFVFPDKKTGSVRLTENVKINDQRRAEWMAEKAEVDRHNERLKTEALREIDAANAKIRRENVGREKWSLSDTGRYNGS